MKSTPKKEGGGKNGGLEGRKDRIFHGIFYI